MKWSLIELRRQSRRKWPARLAITAGALFVLAILFGFFGLPPLLKAQGVKRLSAALHRKVTIEEVRTNPLVLSVEVRGLSVLDHDGSELASWKSLTLNLGLWSRLIGRWHLQQLILDGFTGKLAIARDGRLNLADLLPPAGAPSGPGTTSAPTPLIIDHLEVRGARIAFKDDSQALPFSTVVGPLAFALKNFRTHGDPRAPHELTARTDSGADLSWQGTLSVNPLRSEGTISLSGISLPHHSPYYGSRIQLYVQSGIAAAKLRYIATWGGGQPALRVSDGSLTLTDLKLAAEGGGAPLLTLPELTITGVTADAITREVQIARIAVTGGAAELRRSSAGLDFLNALQPVAAAPKPASAPPTPPPVPGHPLQVRIDAVVIDGLDVSFSDSTQPRPIALKLEKLKANVREFSLSDLTHAMPVQANAGITGGGRLEIAGNLAASPLKAELTVALEQLPVASLSPYLESTLDLWIAKGRAGIQGKLGLSPGDLRFAGSGSIDEIVAVDNAADEEVASWSGLSARAIDYSAAANQLKIGEVSWSDPALRVSVGTDGKLNLVQLRRRPVAASVTSGAANQRPPASASAAPGLAVALDRFVLERARLTFTDRSLQPAVTMALTGLSGSVTGLSSDPKAQASVSLKGKVDDAAPLSLSGRLNPLGSPASADLKLDLRGAELSPVAAYVSKYIGYTLERGALSLAVHLRLADRRIESTDVATLEQFTLGQRTESPDATKLPVTLAIALLKDNRGQIVIDVPVKGSLDDPEFSFGRVVMRVILNLLTKAATSPFALLGAAFGGGGEELSSQLFAGGESALQGKEQPKLVTVARALAERPALRLELIGRYDGTADRDALREIEFHRQVDAAVRERRKSAGVSADQPPIVEAEQIAALADLYAQAFPEVVAAQITTPAGSASKTAPAVEADRPGLLPRLLRLLSGRPAAETAAKLPAGGPSLEKPAAPAAISVEAMAGQLMKRIEVDDNALRELATARAQRVRTLLLESGAISPERVLLAPVAAGGTRVDLGLK